MSNASKTQKKLVASIRKTKQGTVEEKKEAAPAPATKPLTSKSKTSKEATVIHYLPSSRVWPD